MFVKVYILCASIVMINAGYLGGYGGSGHGGFGGGGHGVSSQTVIRQHIPTHGGFHGNDEHSHDIHAYPKYQYKYTVSDHVTADQKSHWENRDGGKVEGQYSLLQPDGKTRTVIYTADEHNGFNAIVQTSGGSQYGHY